MPATDVPATDVPATDVPEGATAALVLADGTVLWGVGFGAHTEDAAPGLGEICFSTGLTGYQETITDPSFAGQIITFTFPHIGNVGTNHDDDEADRVAARGVVVRHMPTDPSNWRAIDTLGGFLRKHGIPGIGGIDTRALTIRIRDGGFVTGIIAYPRDGRFDVAGLLGARAAPGRGWRAWTSRARCRARRATAGTARSGGRSSLRRTGRGRMSWRWITGRNGTSCARWCRRDAA